MKNISVRRLALAGALAAATVLLTMLASFPLPGGHGYVNLGDAGVFVTAYMLGGGWGFINCGGIVFVNDRRFARRVYEYFRLSIYPAHGRRF